MQFYVVFAACLTTVFALDTWEDVHIICPIQCVCLQSHLMELSVARWSHGFLQTRYSDQHRDDNKNDALYDSDTGPVDNPILKHAMCMLQENSNIKDLIVSLPAGVQAFVLLYKGEQKNVTITTSDLSFLSDLYILEIRGTSGQELQLILDEPLPNVRYVNFESINILGSKLSGITKSHSIHPSQLFDYVPESEKDTYNISLEIREEDIEIVPYEIYVMEQKIAKMPSFSEWKQLNVLQIHNSKFDELQWEMFDGLVTLEHLSLEHNDIKVIPPFAFYGAPHIKTLSLARNNILDLNYRALAGLLQLEWLNLSENNLTKVSEISFPPFPKLQTIDLRHNPIKYIFPMTFAVMNNTEEILIGSNAEVLDLSTGSIFQSLEELVQLQMTNVVSLTLGQSLFKGLTKLDWLRIQGDIKRIEFDAFAEMPNVREIILSNCGIQEISMDAFYGIGKLEIIDLSKNKMLFLPPGLFDGQTNIKEIYLQENQLNALPTFFFNLPTVKLIRLTDNPWVCTCDMALWKSEITNRVRSTKLVKDCTMDLKQIKCNENHHDYNYIFDNKLTPRCDGGPTDLMRRNVYYALRKLLKCKSAKDEEREKLRKEKIQKAKHLEAMQMKLYGKRFLTKNQGGGTTTNEKDQRQRKMMSKYRKTLRNDLHYILKTNGMTIESNKHRRTNEFDNNI